MAGNNSICDTATSDKKKEIKPFSGVVDTEEVRKKIESDPFIQQAVHSFLKHSEAKERKEEHEKECAFVNSLLKTPESNYGDEHDTNYVSAILDAKHTKTP